MRTAEACWEVSDASKHTLVLLPVYTRTMHYLDAEHLAPIVTAQDFSPPSVVRKRFFLRALQPAAAKPAGKKTRVAIQSEQIERNLHEKSSYAQRFNSD